MLQDAALPCRCVGTRRRVHCRSAAVDTPLLPSKGSTKRAKVSMVSLGCPKNIVDGEVMLGDLFREGFDITTNHEDADAIVVNTCAFVDEAKAESISAIMDAAAHKAGSTSKRVVVTGCMAQRYAAELAAELPEADLVVGFERYGELAGALHASLGSGGRGGGGGGGAASGGGARVLVGSATVPFRPEWDRHALTPRHTAYLRVAEGCDHACTFCAIPSFRGRFRSKPWDALIDEARRLAASGVVELNLIAEDTNQYGSDFPKSGPKRGLAQLLAALASIPGVAWIRILYAYPSYFDDELISAIADIPQVVKYIDIPLQHAANAVLLAMNRPAAQHTAALLSKLRSRIPGLVLRTTFIAGFPGEREEDHAAVVAFAKDIGFERMGAFTFSEEEGTPAGSYPSQTPPDVRSARRDELVQLSQEVMAKFARSRVGALVHVLVDAVSPDSGFVGRTSLEAPDCDPLVFLSDADGAQPLAVGQMRLCRVEGASEFDLFASPVEDALMNTAQASAPA